MSYLEIILNNCIYLLCPISLYLIYITYRKNIQHEENNLAFEIALTSSLYFILRYGLPLHHNYPTMLFDIPLLLAFSKKKTELSIFISVVLIYYQTLFLHMAPGLLIIEYIIYFIGYLCLTKSKFSLVNLIHGFIIINSFFLTIKVFWFIAPNRSYYDNITYLIFLILVIYVTSFIILYFLNKGEKIVDFNNSLYAIEKEKELRASLFKVTHEIKNPIAVCKGYLDMLDPNDQKKCIKYIPIIKGEINRTLVLMDDFLDYTKIKIEKEELDLVMLLEELDSALKPLFHERKIATNYNIPYEELYMEADYSRLKQVLINIFKNAVEAKDGSKEKSIIEVVVKDLGKDVSIKIKDNGIGMTKEELDKVGQMFFTTKKKGTGLGTCLSKEIIKLHDGNITYSSKKNEWTEVNITLPKGEVMS
ncbi:MAG: HAMP domain-containing sensor histidine kinase [Clostridium sp.]|nr:HAMP domain-containing sensor histidine kinase [Clostridium sp.]